MPNKFFNPTIEFIKDCTVASLSKTPANYSLHIKQMLVPNR